ncbi:MAG: AMP-binding protein, partial [Myxococcales bacterium]|nr:AMP-binding protein [Myxococcales bacterium]
MTAPTIQSVSQEQRVFEPPAAFRDKALLKSREEYEALHKKSIDDPETFWREQAAHLHWFRAPERILEWNPPFAKWFGGGTTNLAYNCLDRHVEAGRGDRTAFIWEGEPGEVRSFSYAELLAEVSRAANMLESVGVKAGDRVGIYMGLVPEAAIAMLACARIGAIHSIVFGGFSPDSLAGRIQDCDSTVVITADEGLRGG